MQGVDGVFHVAAWYKIGADSQEAYKINVEGTRNVLETMRDLKIPKGVYTSTLAVFGDTHGKVPDETHYVDLTKEPPTSEYDLTKWRAHYDVAVPLQKAGLPLVIVMPGVVYGPGDASLVNENIKQYLQGRLPILPVRTAYMWAHVDDVVEGHILAMEKGKIGESYILAGEQATFIEAIHLAQNLTGIPAPRIQVAPAVMRAMSQFMGLVGRVVNLPAMYQAETLRISAGLTYLGNNAKAKRELGYNPRPLREGLKETLDYEMKQLGISPRK
jgi:nucleoside-diphosphate-sugar epimerase